jgi:tagaturonate epimerase
MDETHNMKLRSLRDLEILPQSLVTADGTEFGFARTKAGDQLAVLAPSGWSRLEAFEGEASSYRGQVLLLGPTSSANLDALRDFLPWLSPRTLGLRTSAGMGDRLGLATPGHVRAVRAAGGGLAPIFAQQSIREMERTGRGPRQVMDDATWGVFAEGWQGGYGADADHLKTFADVDACVAAGYTFYTVDPGEYVDDAAEVANPYALRAALGRLPWEELEDSAEDLKTRYLGGPFSIEGHEIRFDEPTLSRASVKYGRAVLHVANTYRHLIDVSGDKEWELEISVDETGSPMTHAQHVYVAGELRRLGVRWVSLAPRYVGRFEKGVDYIGDVAGFEADFAVHAAIARRFGPYKLSLHSGSDKFAIYPAAVRQTRGLVHLKTAGTSYLEALRTVAALDPELFRSIYAFARERYEEDRASYHVSASLDDAPLAWNVDDLELPGLLEQFDAREILHVTFGSVLRDRRFRSRLYELLRDYPDAYATNLEAHFLRHLEPFAKNPHVPIGGSG